eukprot:9259838-Pyramimonas_sp.AAC.1
MAICTSVCGPRGAAGRADRSAMQLAAPRETTKNSRHLLAPDPAEQVAHAGAAMVAPSIWLHLKSP